VTLLFVREDREYLLEPGERFESDLGILDVPDDVTPGDVVQTHLGESFTARKLRGPDLFHHFERTGAPMLPRDVGLVMGHLGVTTSDRVLDAGTGTGVLAAYLARAGATVTTFERDPEFAEVARENMALADVADRVTVRTGDVLDGLADCDAVDAVTLDTEDAPAVVERVPNLLVRGGTLAAYSPFEDAREVAAAARAVSLSDVETVETIQREMDFDDRGSRPSTRGVGHTGYLTFARRT
jgi:tRNA (adenine57-N1/adenine58-N1)-methyltransferase